MKQQSRKVGALVMLGLVLAMPLSVSLAQAETIYLGEVFKDADFDSEQSEIWAKTLLSFILISDGFDVIFGDYSQDEDTSVSSGRTGGSCRTTWMCSDWGECNDGKQYRSCFKAISFCYAGKSPETTKICVTQLPLYDTNSKNNEEPILLNYESSEDIPYSNNSQDSKSLISRITGAAIGVTENADALAILIFAVLVIALAILVYLTRRK